MRSTEPDSVAPSTSRLSASTTRFMWPSGRRSLDTSSLPSIRPGPGSGRPVDPARELVAGGPQELTPIHQVETHVTPPEPLHGSSSSVDDQDLLDGSHVTILTRLQTQSGRGRLELGRDASRRGSADHVEPRECALHRGCPPHRSRHARI